MQRRQLLQADRRIRVGGAPWSSMVDSMESVPSAPTTTSTTRAWQGQSAIAAVETSQTPRAGS